MDQTEAFETMPEIVCLIRPTIEKMLHSDSKLLCLEYP